MPFFILHPREMEQVRKQRNAMIVDIRDRAEYQKYHYKNAVSMPYQNCESWLDKFYKGRSYILYCDYGNTSLLVAKKLSKRGIQVYTVVGGAGGIHQYFKD